MPYMLYASSQSFYHFIDPSTLIARYHMVVCRLLLISAYWTGCPWFRGTFFSLQGADTDALYLSEPLVNEHNPTSTLSFANYYHLSLLIQVFQGLKCESFRTGKLAVLEILLLELTVQLGYCSDLNLSLYRWITASVKVSGIWSVICLIGTLCVRNWRAEGHTMSIRWC